MTKISDDNVFSTMLDIMGDDESTRPDRSCRSSSVIAPPSLRHKPKKPRSKYYTRPIFKEPGSNLTQIAATSEHTPIKKELPKHRVAIIHQLRGEVNKMQAAADDVSVIQPTSRTRARVKTIVGNKTTRHSCPEASRGLESRLMKHSESLTRTRHLSYKHTPVNTEQARTERSLKKAWDGPYVTMQPSDVSAFRREVKGMVETVIPRSESTKAETAQSRQDSTTSAQSHEEMRDAIPGARSHDGGESMATGSLPSVTSVGLMSMWSEVPSLRSMLSDVSNWKFS